MWVVLLHPSVEIFVENLDESERSRVVAAIQLLGEVGPRLGRPLVDTLKGSLLKNLKELRPTSSNQSAIRILFVFDPNRRAVLLVAGNKSGNWGSWYDKNISLAHERYMEYLNENQI